MPSLILSVLLAAVTAMLALLAGFAPFKAAQLYMASGISIMAACAVFQGLGYSGDRDSA